MDMNKLYETLKAEHTEAGRETIVSEAIQEGVNLAELREMLDYLEFQASQQTIRQRHKGWFNLSHLLPLVCKVPGQ